MKCAILNISNDDMSGMARPSLIEWYATVSRITQSKVRVKVTEGKCVKMSTDMHVINRLTVNYDTARPYLNFSQTDFFIIVLVRRHVTFEIMVLWRVDSQSHMVLSSCLAILSVICVIHADCVSQVLLTLRRFSCSYDKTFQGSGLLIHCTCMNCLYEQVVAVCVVDAAV